MKLDSILVEVKVVSHFRPSTWVKKCVYFYGVNVLYNAGLQLASSFYWKGDGT